MSIMTFHCDDLLKFSSEPFRLARTTGRAGFNGLQVVMTKSIRHGRVVMRDAKGTLDTVTTGHYSCSYTAH